MALPLYRVLGLMSGTSLDGIDAALIETDGHDALRPLGFITQQYEPELRERLRACLGKREGAADLDVAVVEREMTEQHAMLVQEFLAAKGLGPEDINLIGFHGQTIFHKPDEGITVQIGDGALLAVLTGIPVVGDFRSADVQAGGQGAPLVPLYHRALMAALPKPVAVINIGGVSNITWIGGDKDEDLLAFDLGPGNALIDDWMLRHTGKTHDKDGKLAAMGHVDEAFIARFMADPFFALKPPKSLDRDRFSAYAPEGLSVADGAATLTTMTVRAIVEGLRLLPRAPRHLYLTGGGRHNGTMLRWLREQSGLPVSQVGVLGWNGDALEAEAFAYLAVRSKLRLPLSMPGTTGVPYAMTGGTKHEAGAGMRTEREA